MFNDTVGEALVPLALWSAVAVCCALSSTGVAYQTIGMDKIAVKASTRIVADNGRFLMLTPRGIIYRDNITHIHIFTRYMRDE